MKTIYKYALQTTDVQQVMLPIGAHILATQVQNGSICLWAVVDPAVPLEPRTFNVFGTGHPLPLGDGFERSYLGTVQMAGGALVFHVFERHTAA